MATESIEETERRFAGFEADSRPGTEEGKARVRRVAILAVRMGRCVAREAAAVPKSIRGAESDIDQGRKAEVEQTMKQNGENSNPVIYAGCHISRKEHQMLDA